MNLYIIDKDESFEIGLTKNPKEVMDRRPGDEKFVFTCFFPVAQDEFDGMKLPIQQFQLSDREYERSDKVLDWVTSLRKYHNYAFSAFKRPWMSQSFLDQSELMVEDIQRNQYYRKLDTPWGIDGDLVIDYLKEFDRLMFLAFRSKSIKARVMTLTDLMNAVGCYSTGSRYVELRKELSKDSSRLINMLNNHGYNYSTDDETKPFITRRF